MGSAALTQSVNITGKRASEESYYSGPRMQSWTRSKLLFVEHSEESWRPPPDIGSGIERPIFHALGAFMVTLTAQLGWNWFMQGRRLAKQIG